MGYAVFVLQKDIAFMILRKGYTFQMFDLVESEIEGYAAFVLQEDMAFIILQKGYTFQMFGLVEFEKGLGFRV